MRATSIIYKRELGRYLRSPLGWIIAAAALFASGVLFYAFALSRDALSAVVLEQFFWSTSGVVMFVSVVLSFWMISIERQNHSIVLLKTSPIRDTDIVAGKFFAALTFLAIVLALSTYIPLLIKVHGKVSVAQIFVGYVGLLLLGSATLSIGLFASALTKHPMIAALLATLFTVVLVLLFPLAKKLDAPIADVLKELDLWWVHFQNGFMKGLLNLKDVVYYVAVTYFFLLLSVKTLEAKRWQ